MTIIQRYLLRDFAALFGVVSVGLSTVVTLLDLLKRMDDLLPHDPSAWTLAWYALLTFPRYFVYTVPVATLLCTLYTVGHAARNQELTAVRAAGIRLRKVFLPLVVAGLVLSGTTFLLSEAAVPACSREARAVRNRMQEREQLPSGVSHGRVWLRATERTMVRIGLYEQATDTYMDVNIFELEDGGLDRVIQARSGRYEQQSRDWLLKDVVIHDLGHGGYEEHTSYRFTQLASPEVFGEAVRKPYEMEFFELRSYLVRLREAGFSNPRLEVEIHQKISYPFICLIMALLGVSLPARRSMGGLVATALGLVISLAYWFGFTLCLSLGYAGVVPPLVAAWMMPVIFGAGTVRLYLKMPE